MNKFFVTFGFTGLAPFAPGTFGSIAGALVAYPILIYLNQSTLFLLAILITLFSIKPIDIYCANTNKHDPKEVVIDEVAGVFLALSLSSGTATQFILSLVLFRVFDIWKPSIIGYCDKKIKGGLGVMLDDIAAGVFAGLLSLIIYMSLTKLGFTHLFNF